MRVGFQRRPWDIVALASGAIALWTALTVTGSGSLLAAPLLLFLPGYAVVAALFPTENGMGWGDRLAFSLGLSIAVVAILGVVLILTPFGLGFESILSATSIFTVAAGGLAGRRRLQLPIPDRLSLTLELSLPRWEQYSFLEKGLTLVVVVACVGVVALFASIAITPSAVSHFTQFYVLGPSGSASGYPTRLNVSENGSVILGINNHEATTVNYTVVIDLVGVRIFYNATAGVNETMEVNRTTWSNFTITVADGANWTQPYTFFIPSAGFWKVQFLLFKDGDFSVAYREVRLYVQVTL